MRDFIESIGITLLITNLMNTEVVLSVLLSKFSFATSGKEVNWNMNDLATPNQKGDATTPTMPLTVIPL